MTRSSRGLRGLLGEVGPGRQGGGLQAAPVQHFEAPVVVLGHEGAGFHEVARVDVGDAADVTHRGVVDVAADHPVGAVAEVRSLRLLGRARAF